MCGSDLPDRSIRDHVDLPAQRRSQASATDPERLRGWIRVQTALKRHDLSGLYNLDAYDRNSRAFRHSSGLYTVCPLTIRCFWIAGGPTVDNQSCCRKASTLSVGLNLSEVASVGASFSRARSFVARSASMAWTSASPFGHHGRSEKPALIMRTFIRCCS